MTASDPMQPVLDLHARALALLTDQCNDLAGAVAVLAAAIRDIEYHARISRRSHFSSQWDEALQSIIHICQTGGVRAALEAS